jgi:hypothetical protein
MEPRVLGADGIKVNEFKFTLNCLMCLLRGKDVQGLER